VAVPSSGELQLAKIYNEVDVDNYSGINSEPTNLSLDGLHAGTYGTINTSSGSYPDNTEPHQMSEWYSYDHDAVASPSATDYWDDQIWFGDKLKHRFDANFDDSYAVGDGTTVTNIGAASGGLTDGTLVNMTEGSNWTQRPSLTSPGYWTFNGSDESIMATAPVSNLFATGAGFTCWMYPTNSASSNTGTVMSIGDSNGNYLFRLVYNRGRLACYHYHGSTTTKTDLPAGDNNGTNNWQAIYLGFRKVGSQYRNYMLAGTGVSDDEIEYVDEYLTTTGPATLSGTQTFSLGCNFDSTDYFAGRISSSFYFNSPFYPNSGVPDSKTEEVWDEQYPIHGF